MFIKKKIKYRDIIKRIFLFLVFFSTVQIPYLDTFDIIGKIYNGLILFCFIISILYLIKTHKISKLQLVIFLFYLYYLFITFCNKGNCKTILIYFLSGFALCNISERYIHKDYKTFIGVAAFFFEIIIYINFISIILFPEGLYINSENKNEHYFLGHKNNAIEYILPALCFSYLNSLKKNHKIGERTIFLFLISSLTVVFTWSATAIVSMGILVFYFIIPKLSTFLQKYTNIWHYFIMSICLFITFITFRFQSYFEWFIVNVLHKSVNFTYRTEIWDNAMFYIKKNPVFGYGYEHFDIKYKKIGHANSAHNYYLDLLYSGGIILLSLYLVMLCLISKSLKEYKNNSESKVIIGILASYFIVGFATPIHMSTVSLMFLIFIIGGSLFKIVDDKEKRNCEK